MILQRAIYSTSLFLLFLFNAKTSISQGVSINETGNPPAGCALLEVQPDVNFNKGLLLPRLTTVQRNSIPSPVEGLLIYNTTTSCFEIYNGSVWYSLGCQCSGPPAATTATAASGITSSGFTANWGGVVDATTFYLDVATDAGFTILVTGYNNLNVGNVTGYTVTGLDCNTTYYYRLRAANPCGVSANSNTISLTTLSSAPSAPTAGAATNVTGSSFDANWNNTGGSAYFIDVATDAGFTAFVPGYNNLNIGNVLTYTVTGLGCNSVYYYRVRASSSCGTSPSSNTITVTTGTSAPSAPIANAASGVTGGSFYANWTAVGSATYYELDIATDAGFTAFVPGYNSLNVGNVVTYNITGLNCNTPYYYRVRSANGCGTSSNSNTVTQTTGSSAPSAPTASSATSVTSTSFSANWSAVGSATKYYLDVATDAGFISFVPGYNDLDVGNVTTYNAVGLTCVNTYYYRVRAFNPCGTSANSNTITVVPGNGCSALYAWQYKIPVTITNGGSGLTDFQILIILNTQVLVTGGKMQSGGQDIRVTDSDKCTEIPFWIETGTMNTTATNVWVNVPSVPAGAKTIYLYYGNGAASDISDGDATFEFFDDFGGVSLNLTKWVDNTTSSTVGGSVFRINIGAARTNNLGINLNDGYILEGRVIYYETTANYSGTLTGMGPSNYTAGSNGNADATVLYMRNTSSTNVNYWIGNGAATGYNVGSGLVFTSANDTWYVLGIKFYPTGVTLTRDYSDTNTFATAWSKNVTRVTLGYFTGTATDIPDIGYNWIKIRKYSSPEPTTANGTEESGCN